MAATGFDPMRDLDTLTVAKIGSRDGLVIAQGRIDKLRLPQFLTIEQTGARSKRLENLQRPRQ
jgi:hypothetical protein